MAQQLNSDSLTVKRYPPYWLDQRCIKVFASKIRFADSSFSNKLFEQEIVGCCCVVVSICLDALFSEVAIEAKFDCLFEHLLIDRNAMVSDDDSLIGGLRGRELPPSMLPDVVYSEAFGGIYSQDLCEDIFGIF